MTTEPSPSSPLTELAAWYRTHGRHGLPWRRTRDAYAVLVSVVMLQQTQVARVLPVYEAWLRLWPDATALATAAPAEVIRAWGGMGYNRRAVYLHRSSLAIRVEHGGGVPIDPHALERLPGVGPYTAAAVACFAGGSRIAVLDTNVGRVLARAWGGEPGAFALGPARLRELATALLPLTEARDHNLALMDLGALVCRSRTPACEACPLSSGCAWLAAGRPGGAFSRGAAVAFENTARFARGRIVAALREAESLTEAELRSQLPGTHQPRVAAYLRGLESDGLIRSDGSRWTLGGAAQSTSIASPKLKKR